MSSERSEFEQMPLVPTDDNTTSIDPIGQLGTAPRLVEPISGREINLVTLPRAIIGRADDTAKPDIDLTPFGGTSTSGVSRRHAQITVTPQYTAILDLTSKNGTRVNGRALLPDTPCALHEGDVIEIGGVKLIFRLLR